MLCWHRWNIEKTEILPSLIEQMNGGRFKMTGESSPSYKPAIITKRCDKCGAEKVVRV